MTSNDDESLQSDTSGLTLRQLEEEEEKFRDSGSGKAEPKNQDGKYKIDIQLLPSRVNSSLIAARVSIMLSGSVDSSNGAITAFRCANVNCKKIIDPSFTNSSSFYCPHCKAAGPIEYVSEGANIASSVEGLAKYVHGLWLSANGDASLLMRRQKYLCMHALRQAFLDKNYALADRLRKLSREKPERVLYPLRNLIKDNLSGMDMQKRIEQFLRA